MRVIGIGNPDRGDDAVGWAVVDRLDGIVDAERSTGDPAALLDRWAGLDDVVLVDATCCGRTPGSVSVVDLLERRLPAGTVHSSHGLGPLEAVDLGRALGVLPGRLTLVGIEGRSWGEMTSLTPAVHRAVGRVAEMIGAWARPGVLLSRTPLAASPDRADDGGRPSGEERWTTDPSC